MGKNPPLKKLKNPPKTFLPMEKSPFFFFLFFFRPPKVPPFFWSLFFRTFPKSPPPMGPLKKTSKKKKELGK